MGGRPYTTIIISGLKYQDTVSDIGLNYQFAEYHRRIS